jgi:UDP-N-acetyl-D-glucosamine dehydrogenase
MPTHVMRLISDALNDDRKCIKGSKILILGAAYKKNVDDIRESPALEIIELLEAKGADVQFSDPYIPCIIVDGKKYESLPCDAVTLGSMDCVVIVTNHDSFDYDTIGNNAKIIVDTRNAMKVARSPKGRVVKL